ncbi:MAG: SurA N-terminal domain-containing protein [Holosporales bacterium]|jgi:hypothetical protein|nr:SurA N-terminal domain-containing protein [Holosporales bacterium]
MLEFIRGFSRSIAAKLLFFLIAFVFILWGMGGVIMHLGTPDYLLKVGSKKVTAREFSLTYRRYKENLQERFGFISDEKAKEMKLPEQVLLSFIHQHLVAQELSDCNLYVGDKVVMTTMRTDPRFRDETGAFNKNMLRAALASFRLPEEAFLRHLRQETEMSLFSLPFFLAHLPPVYAAALNAAVSEKREVAYAIIEEKNVLVPAEQPPGDLKNFYDEHQEYFIVPEQRLFTVAEVDKEAIEKTIVIAEEDIKRAYDQYIERSVDEPTIKSLEEMRAVLEKDLRQEVLVERVADAIRTLEDALAGGKTIEELATQYPLVQLTTSTWCAKPLFHSKFVPAHYAKVATELHKELGNIEEGGNGTFIETREGRWIFVRVDKIIAEHVEIFEKVKEKVLECWRIHQRKDRMKALAQNLLEELKKGKTLKDLTTLHHLSYATLRPFSYKDIVQHKAPIGKEYMREDFLMRLQKAPIGEGIVEEHFGKTCAGTVIVAAAIKAFPDVPADKTETSFQWQRGISADLCHQALNYSRNHRTIKINEQVFQTLGEVAPVSYDD